MKTSSTPVIIATIIVAAALIGVIVWYNQNASNSLQAPAGNSAADASSSGVDVTASGTLAAITTSTPNTMNTLQITDLTVGTGTVAKNGDSVSVLYTGTLDDGTVFDASTLHGNQPFVFTLGAGQVIQGWDQGVVGMKVGGKRELVIPSSLGYGANSVGSIPPNSTLHFTVQLLNVSST